MASAAVQVRAQKDRHDKAASQKAGDLIRGDRDPAEHRPGQPERGERAQPDRQVAVAVGIVRSAWSASR